MKLFITSAALALLATVAQAAPAGYFSVQVKFIGAAGAEFTESFPADGRQVTITNPLSISKIQSSGGGTCSFHGVDGSNTITVGAQTVDVGPPQTQVSGSCRSF